MTQEGIPAPSSASVAGALADDDEKQEAPVDQQADGGSEEEVDWQAKAVEAEGRASKLESDLRSMQGRRSRQVDQDAVLHGLGDRLDAMEKSNSALVNALASGNTDDLPGELTQIQQQATQGRTEVAFQTGYQALWDELQETVKGDDGTSVLDPQTAPEFAAVRTRWNERTQARDLGGLAVLLSEANKIVRSTERVAHKKALDDEKKARKAERKKTLDDVGALDTDTGPGAGGAGDNLMNEPMSGTRGLKRIQRGLAKQAQAGT